MQYTQVLNRLQDVKPTLKENSWVACCPAHEDRSPSLSITLDFDEKLLLHCYAGCTIQEVCAAIGIELSDLYPDRPLSHKAKTSHSISLAKRYTILDEMTTLAFHVVNAYLRHEISAEEHQQKMQDIAKILRKIKA